LSPKQLAAGAVCHHPAIFLLQPVAAAMAADPCPASMAAIPGDSYRIGADTLTGVNDADYQPPFRFTGTLNKLSIKLNRPQLSAEDTKSLEAAMRTKAISE
jgi:arylsulfatase